MIKKTVILFVECAMILFLGIILIITFTGGISVASGPLRIKAYNFQNPLLILIVALLLRRVLTGSFLDGFLVARYFERYIKRCLHSPSFRKRIILIVALFFLVTVVTIVGKPLQTGLIRSYYNNREWTGTPLSTTSDHTFDLDQIKREFPTIKENYSIQWNGVIFIPVADEYQFSTGSDDGSELSIHEQIIVNNRGLHGFKEKTGSVYLEKGFHPIQIRYMQGLGGTELQIHWQRPGTEREALAHALLFQETPTNISFSIYLIRKTILPMLIVLWYLFSVLLGLGLLEYYSPKLAFSNRIHPLTEKLFIFFLINGLIVNLVLSFFSAGKIEDGPIVRDINVGLYCTRFFVLSPTHDRLDSWEYLYKAREYLSEPQETTLYSELYFNQHKKFQYPPVSVLLVEPFRGLSLRDFIATANFLSWLATMATIVILAHLLALSIQQWIPSYHVHVVEKIARLGLAFCFTITFYPLMWSFRLGQIQTWIYFFFVCAIWAWLSGKKGLSGALIGIICIIKPQLGLLGLWGLLRKQWRFVAGLAIIIGILGTISLYRYGFANHLEYLQFLSYMSKYGESYYPNQSVNGLLNRFLFNGPNVFPKVGRYPPYNVYVYSGTLISSLLLIAAALFWKAKQHRHAEMIDFSIAALTFTVASPIAWIHHYSIMLPLFALALPATLARCSNKRGIWLLAASFALSSNFYFVTNYLANSRFNVLQSLLFFGAVLFLGHLYHLRTIQAKAHEQNTSV